MITLCIVVYTAFVYYCAQKILQYTEAQHTEVMYTNERQYKNLVELKKTLYNEKMSLEEEAIKILTLYELTKDVTKTFHEEEAFKVLENNLKQHVRYDECHLLAPEDRETKNYKNDDQYYIFTLQGKRRKIGCLVIKNLNEEDKEKFTILAQQFALALRRVKLYQEIEKIAITDSLTEVSTRRYTLERLKEELGRSKNRGMKLSYLMIDVDFFKKINDQYGHITGDQVLR